MDIPFKLQPLFQPARYKILYGGRGSGKSWSIARVLLVMGTQRRLRVLCVREQQNSMKDSVYALLKDQIVKLGFSKFYTVLHDTIVGPNGTSFAFEGVRHNYSKIKSYEGIDICWAEEADKISEVSWDTIIPTIRGDETRPDTEIWVSFNPNLESDYTYKFFVKSPQPDSIVIEMNWRDNKWFPSELRKHMERMKETDPDKYLHIYEGKCKTILTGAVYAKELRQTQLDGRICEVPYQKSGGLVDVFFDLGWSDATSLWLRQRVGFEWHYLRYYEERHQAIAHYLDWLQQARCPYTKQMYNFGTFWLPHDARAKEKGSGLSVEERVRNYTKSGTTVTRIVKKLTVEDGIDAARSLFPSVWFDEEHCADGLKALRGYKYDVKEQEDGSYSITSRAPVHDEFSHGSDSFRYSAVASGQPKTVKIEEAQERFSHSPLLQRKKIFSNLRLGAHAWMAK